MTLSWAIGVIEVEKEAVWCLIRQAVEVFFSFFSPPLKAPTDRGVSPKVPGPKSRSDSCFGPREPF